MTWERARTDAQKQIRLQEIYAVARQQLLSIPYASISFASIAKELHFSRANLYKYFASKEDIYLSLLAEETTMFAKQLSDSLQQHAVGDFERADFIRIWFDLFVSAQVLRILFSMAAVILEKNCADTVLIDTKKQMMDAQFTHVLPVLGPLLPELSQHQLIDLQMNLILIGNGVLSFCGLNAHQKTLLRRHGLEGMVHADFATEYRRSLNSLFGCDL